MLAPMTFIVTLALIFVVVIGVTVLLRAMGRSDSDRDLKLGTKTKCPDCQEPNLTHAKFCAKCGKALR